MKVTLKMLRVFRDWSQERAAKEVGFSVTTWRNRFSH